ncbi:MAG TPA: response regulator transcription factor [Terriglobales bacterium]|nr:response regulator transcription factor [Terriglobales bacterium]
MKENVLLVDDEKALRSSLGVRLRGEGYLVDTAANATEGFQKATSLPFDVIILDLMLPDRSGLDLCREIREAGIATPLIVLSARQRTTDKVVALNSGADDYVTKPFKAAELVARIQALLRRVPIRSGHSVHQFGLIRVDFRRAEVTRDDKPVHLSVREFQLLRYLIERSGNSVSRVELLSSVWGYDAAALTRTVDVHVASLRNKLEENPSYPELIVTVSRVGYKFVGSRRS